MLEETADREEIIARVAALDIGKAEVVCCVRVPHEGRPGRRLQEVRAYSAMTRSLLSMADHLRSLGVTRVVMEATSDYWKPVFWVLEAAGFETWLVNARDVKHLPGRPKTDELDAVWLCKVAERQMIRPSFVPPPQIRRLRDVTRYRIDLTGARSAEKNRAEKLLEDAGIKLSVVASDFTDHHAFLLGKMLARIDGIDADIAELDGRLEELIAPFARAADRLDEIPGIGRVAAAIIIAEIGTDMTRFPTAAHFASWAKFAPGVKESAGKKKGSGATGHGNAYLARVLGEAAAGAARTDTVLGDRYRRIARRRGKKKASVAVGRPAVMWSLSPARAPAPLPKIGEDCGISETCRHRSLKLADVQRQAGVSLRYFRIGQSPARCRCEQPGDPRRAARPGTAVRNVRHADEPPGSPVRLIG